jgi:chemotaxis protein methyltransferase CheR
VSCRNVLIYFDEVLQERAIDLFHQSLAPRGFLGLGSHERLDAGRNRGRFEDVAPADRVYRRSA